jgi:uncharacterized protein
MPAPLMPKATAVWLIDKTKLSFEQIGEFCQLHKLEIQAIADGEVAEGINGLDPVANGQLTMEEIKRCENDPRARLKMIKSDLPQPVVRSKGPRYTPVSKRAEKPDAIAYLIKHHPELQDAQIARLLGTTKETIAKVRDRSHWNSSNIKPNNPVLLGLCKQADLDAAIKRAERRIAREKKGLKEEEETQDAAGNVVLKTEEAPEFEDVITDFGTKTEEAQPDIDPDDMFRSIG